MLEWVTLSTKTTYLTGTKMQSLQIYGGYVHTLILAVSGIEMRTNGEFGAVSGFVVGR